jgi:hypothetical protein
MPRTVAVALGLIGAIAAADALHAQQQQQQPQPQRVAPAKAKLPLQFPIRQKLPDPAPEGEVNTVTINAGTEQESMLDTVTAVLGRGYNSLLDEVKGTCLNGSIFGFAPKSFPVRYSLSLIKSFEQFNKETSAEASLDTKFASFSASVSAKMSSVASTTGSSESLFVRVKVGALPEINLKGRELDQGPVVRNPPSDDANSQRAFFRRCGDRYINQITMGGEFLAVFHLATVDSEARQAIEAHFSAGGFSTSVSADFKQKVETVTKNSSMQIDMYRIGGSGAMPDQSVDAIIQYATAFPAQVNATNLAPVAFATDSFENLGTPGESYESQRASIRDLQRSVERVSATVDQLIATEAFYKQYRLPDPSATGAFANVRTTALNQRQQAQRTMRDMQTRLRNCGLQPWSPKGECTFPDGLVNTEETDLNGGVAVRLDPASPNTRTFYLRAPTAMFTIRGQLCWTGGNACFADGISTNGVYIEVTNGNDKPFRYAGPVLLKQGTIRFRVVDTYYPDNSGTVHAVAYAPPL